MDEVTSISNMWEILVPTIHRETGRPIKTRFHKVWDKEIYGITKGLTITKPTIGKWVSDENELFEERMIPVRIACTRDEILEIMRITKKYYNQLAVICYKISEEVIMLK
jgi:hypothetical protein